MSEAERNLTDAHSASIGTENEGRDTKNASENGVDLGLNFSEDELSDLDENQFENFDESKIGHEDEEPTIYNLPSFKKKHREALGGSDEKIGAAGAARGRRRRTTSRTTADDFFDEQEEHPTKESKRKPRKQVPVKEERPADPVLAAKWDLDRRIDAVLKPARGKKRSMDDDLEQMADEEIMRLREQMRQAAIRDAELNSEQKPATEKLRMLPFVETVLRKSNLQDVILDNNLLDSVRMWLEPLPDRSLPALNIQHVLFDVLRKLPIQTEHLRESGLGKVVLFYTLSKKPEPFIRRMADTLVNEWSRPIIKRSANYRDRAVSVVTLNPEMLRRQRSSAMMSHADDGTENSDRTVIPQSVSSKYQIAPRVRLNSAAMYGRMKPADSEQVRKLKAKMKAIRSKPTRRSGVSIEGRGL
ncbi:transcription elongation factor complex subunit Iws1 [Schizosaccharomyces japonicus yFS275]|uniref:Transcription elongation factor complex subunit Iws1 n=1 Tax=Schizosaccharomyces japonicus (strain yFS275 / FY16936) TaxID=402676 RepID=B6K1U8_SCHJY|nr:transcription elongation factor complex subunit Iws1 [Schizosaccharomyces japonicus yFS275]EEB07129.1 transcription elongation factor complex subunit Iws1 [Schizosaccharomyces japonicus yFS275]